MVLVPALYRGDITVHWTSTDDNRSAVLHGAAETPCSCFRLCPYDWLVRRLRGEHFFDLIGVAGAKLEHVAYCFCPYGLRGRWGPGDDIGRATVDAISQSNSENGGGCLIATATYGSELAPQVQQLRELRDNKLLNTESGTSFMESFNDFYYSFSPIIADYERENLVFREMVKIAITPMISSLSILNYVDMDSEVEVLGYGISLILLNVGMYFVAPMLIIKKVIF